MLNLHPNHYQNPLSPGAARIEYDLFKRLYTYLAEVDGNITEEHIESVIAYLDNDASKGEGLIGPANFTHAFCPKLNGQ